MVVDKPRARGSPEFMCKKKKAKEHGSSGETYASNKDDKLTAAECFRRAREILKGNLSKEDEDFLREPSPSKKEH